MQLIIGSMKKDKILGPNGWKVEFLEHLFDLMGDTITNVVQESRSHGHIHDALKRDFPMLFPKKDSLHPLMISDLFLYVTAYTKLFPKLLLIG